MLVKQDLDHLLCQRLRRGRMDMTAITGSAMSPIGRRSRRQRRATAFLARTEAARFAALLA